MIQVMANELKDILSKLSHVSQEQTRSGCTKCGYPGHFTYQCRNFVRVNPAQDILLDVSSTSSESSDDEDNEDLLMARMERNNREVLREQKEGKFVFEKKNKDGNKELVVEEKKIKKEKGSKKKKKEKKRSKKKKDKKEKHRKK
jgi:hypothetical protein